MKFNIDQQLLNDGPVIYKLALCDLILVNNKLFPWLILVPRINDAVEIIDLNQEHQTQFLKEINITAKILKEVFIPHKLNIAALGNMVRQLHVHIVARFTDDVSFPKPVFGGPKEEYLAEDLAAIVEKLVDKLDYVVKI